MSKLTKQFLKHQALTTPFPIAFEVDRALGNYIYGKDGKGYLDLVAGVSACNLGHGHPIIVDAIKEQADRYLHVMVYGEYIQEPQVNFTTLLASLLPKNLQVTYLVNSGTEAIEGSLKLAKRYTGRSEVIASKGAYHGSTHGSLSIMGNETYKQAFRPLLPNVKFIEFNNLIDIERITKSTACIILETIQGAAGFIEPKNDYLKAVREKCNQTGTLLIFDEIQPGFGRTGKLFGFMNYNVTPDILVIGKAMGGGMPTGAFVASKEIMRSISENPILGHITTFGGHPVIAAASYANLKYLNESGIIDTVEQKEIIFREHLKHPAIKEVRGKGLMLAALVESEALCHKIAKRCMERGIILFWLLFEGRALRITPPLTITKEEIIYACKIINETLDELT